MAREKLGEFLVRSGLLTPEQLQYALREHQRTGVRLGQIVVDHRLVSEHALYDALARHERIPRLDMRTVHIQPQAANRVDAHWATENRMIPVEVDLAKKTIHVVISDPSNVRALDEIQFRTGLRVLPVMGSESEVDRLIRHHFFLEPLDREPRQTTRVPRIESTSGANEVMHGMDEMMSAVKEATDVLALPRSGPARGPSSGSSPAMASSGDWPAIAPDPRPPSSSSWPAQPSGSWPPPPPDADLWPSPPAGGWSPPQDAGIQPSSTGNLRIYPEHHMPQDSRSADPARSPSDSTRLDREDPERAALAKLKPIYEVQQDAARALQAIFELCVARGIITREEYLERLKRTH